MAKWEPILLNELLLHIEKTEKDLGGELLNFWQLIKIDPLKWTEKDFGADGGGFWVVAICGKRVVWYNDIEEGFNISNYNKWGEIQEYFCDQNELNFAVMRLFEFVKSGRELSGQRGTPEAFN